MYIYIYRERDIERERNSDSMFKTNENTKKTNKMKEKHKVRHGALRPGRRVEAGALVTP